MPALRNVLITSAIALLAVSAVRVSSVALHEVALLIGCGLCLFGARSNVSPRWLTLGAGLLLLGSITSFAAAGFPSDSLGKVIAFVLIPIAVGWVVLRLDSLRPVQVGISILLALVTAYALLQWIGVAPALPWQTGDASPMQYLEQGRIPGHALSPNLLAMELVSAGVLLLGFLKRNTLAWALAGLPVLWILFLTRSRASWIGAAAAGAFMVWYLLRDRLRYQRAWLVICGVLAGVVTYLVLTSTDPSATSRQEIWGYTWQLLQSSPVWGGSFSGFQEAVGQLAAGNPGFLTHGLPYAVHPHQLFLATWWHTGLIGLIGLCAIIVGVFWQRPRSWLAACAQASCVAIVVNGLLDRTFWQADLAVLAAIAVAIVVKTRHAA